MKKLTVLLACGITLFSQSKLLALLLNHSPTITAPPDQTILVNTTTAILPFIVGDEDPGDLDFVGFSAFSSNLPLVPPQNIFFGGSGANRSIFITPEPDQTGETIIAMAVFDPHGGSGSATFKLTVIDLPAKVPESVTWGMATAAWLILLGFDLRHRNRR